MTRKCPSCTADVLDNAKFCIKCGTKMPALPQSPTVAAPIAPPSPSPSPSPSPIRAPSIAEPVSVHDSAIAPVKEAIPHDDSNGVKEEVRPPNSVSSKRAEVNESKSGGKGIIFAVVGVVVVGGAAFFLMSGKQSPAPSPATAPATVTAPTTPEVAPVKPATPEVPVAPKPTPKPTVPAAAPVAPAAPAAPVAPASSAPDINKIMRDAANK